MHRATWMLAIQGPGFVSCQQSDKSTAPGQHMAPLKELHQASATSAHCLACTVQCPAWMPSSSISNKNPPQKQRLEHAQYGTHSNAGTILAPKKSKRCQILHQFSLFIAIFINCTVNFLGTLYRPYLYLSYKVTLLQHSYLASEGTYS